MHTSSPNIGFAAVVRYKCIYHSRSVLYVKHETLLDVYDNHPGTVSPFIVYIVCTPHFSHISSGENYGYLNFLKSAKCQTCHKIHSKCSRFISHFKCRGMKNSDEGRFFIHGSGK